MIRVLIFILCVVAAALGLAWLAERPGTITVEWLGYQIETSAMVGALAIVGIVVLLMVLWGLLRYLYTRPAAIAGYARERRKRQGYDALSRGLLAIGVGDRTLAQRYAGIATRNLPREPLTGLLRAQAAQLKGDKTAARRAFEAMLDDPETHLLGVRGLFLEAKRSNDNAAAQALAEQAVSRDPKLAWSVNALFDLRARAGDFEGALDTLAIARQNGHIEPDVAVRRRAVLLTAEAREREVADPDKALALANEALRLAPSLVPAAEIASRILASKGESRVGIGDFPLARLCREKHSTTAHRDIRLDVPVLAGDGERIERALEVAGARLQIEQCIHAPGKLRITTHRLFGESLGRGIVIAALRFEEESAYAEQMRLGIIEHGFEGAPRRGFVALELRRLGPEQPGERLARKIARGDAGITLRQRTVTDPDGKETAGKRVIALPFPALSRVARDGCGTRVEIAQESPHHHE